MPVINTITYTISQEKLEDGSWTLYVKAPGDVVTFSVNIDGPLSDSDQTNFVRGLDAVLRTQIESLEAKVKNPAMAAFIERFASAARR